VKSKSFNSLRASAAADMRWATHDPHKEMAIPRAGFMRKFAKEVEEHARTTGEWPLTEEESDRRIRKRFTAYMKLLRSKGK
jgi:hypothetical protein